MEASLRCVVQLHKDVPKAAKLYSEGLGFAVNVCTPHFAELELQPGPLKLALMQFPLMATKPANSENVVQHPQSTSLYFTVADIDSTVTKLMALGAELDAPIAYETHGKIAAIRCFDGHVFGIYEPQSDGSQDQAKLKSFDFSSSTSNN